MDKALPHCRSRKVKDSLEQSKGVLIPVYLPTAFPEFMMLEEIWNKVKRGDLLELKYYPSFDAIKRRISLYFGTKRFGQREELYIERCLKYMLIGMNWNQKCRYN